MLITIGLLFLVGITFGSFFGVVGLRIPKSQSIIRPGSSCDNCHRQLGPLELIPVVSYLFHKGRCRFCHVKLSPMYLFIELLTGVLFASLPFVTNWSEETIIVLTLVSLFVIITVSDLAYMIIPNKVLGFFSVLFLIEQLVVPRISWSDAILGAVTGFAILLLIAFVSRGRMGGGDIKLFGLIGFVVGVKLVLLTLFLSCFIGTIVGVSGMVVGKLKKGQYIPFGPSIFVGTIIASIYGEALINWYQQFIL
ncbi:prepilin peptidase [Bacillus sp. AFS002410]|uniref:prepilin peptidase n=1 Tax=Bacillus sp. AFS002410 TaxID=2033481 RepID=UPI000BF159A4|nr:A24 family peptidase [Bacillus sp. AFS002410]PEJ49359.1 prepilin peptidase [Bacillus sp. AFS002410]